MGIRNCTVSSGWAVPGRTSWMKKLVRKTRSWGLPSWYRGYLQGGGGKQVMSNAQNTRLPGCPSRVHRSSRPRG